MLGISNGRVTHRSGYPDGITDCRRPPHHQVGEDGDPDDAAEESYHEKSFS